MTELELCQQNVKACEEEIGKGIIGQKEIIRQVMLALLAGRKCIVRRYAGTWKDHARAYDQRSIPVIF